MFKKYHLDNGIPLVAEQIRNVRSVSLGIWVKVGSRYESTDSNGISHFLEHMFFKGTKRRSARDIAVEIDSVGGDLNAFTSREATTFYVKVLDEHIERGIDLLTDLFLHSTFPAGDLEKEKRIIKEEIKMVEDTPDDYIHDLFYQAIWGDEGIGQSILGRRETIKSFGRDDLMDHIRKYYGTKDTVIACAGNFQPDRLISSLNETLGGLRRGSEPKKGGKPLFSPSVAVHAKDLSEAHVCIGVEGIPLASTNRYVLYLLNSVLGAGVSSRLFQEIRETRGLAYSIYSFLASYIDTGLWAVYAGTARKRVTEVITLITEEMKSLKDTITDVELQRAKDQMKGNLILGLESSNNRMQNIARQEIYYGQYYSPEEIIREIEAVSLEQARDLSERLVQSGAMALTVLGPVERSTVSELPL
ncbi:MAG TPA: pitrilysin family protein [Thermodesulfovibrionales bacterium]|jgi:predicted Zn-dependent peptidase|nr:pitrilysin family protein [Thermodesulfovibrionales bacterium]